MQYYPLPRGTMPLEELARQQKGRAGHREEQPSAGSMAGDSGNSFGHLSCLWEVSFWGQDSREKTSLIKVWREKGYLSNQEGPLETIQSKSPAQSKDQPEQDAQSQILHL